MNNPKYTTDLMAKLPKLPVPSLEVTLKRLKKWSTPLLSDKEFTDLDATIDQFAKSDGLILQQRLMDMAKQTEGSWLASIWETGYLSNRKPLQSSSNFAFTVSPDDIPENTSLAHLTAEIIDHLTESYLSFATGKQPIEQFHDGSPMDMSYYLNFFKSMRFAHVQEDTFHQGIADIREQKVTIIHGGQIFFVQVTDENGQQTSINHIESQINGIIKRKDNNDHFPGIITSLPREEAAQLLTKLWHSPHNKAVWNSVADSLFSVSLVETLISGNYLKEVLLGINDRFVDKTLQVVVFNDLHVGFAIEHSRVDGVPALNLIQHAMTGLTSDSAIPITDAKLDPKSFELDAELTANLANAYEAAEKWYTQMSIASHSFKHFGKTRIKTAKVSPDAFFHIALALAMFRLTGQWRSIYEPVSMRAFYQGRTENARSVNIEKKRFIIVLQNGESSVQLKPLFEVAAKAHTDRIRLAQNGYGVERHLLGLETVFNKSPEGLEVADKLFHSKQLAKLRTDYLSTTSIPFSVIQGLTFAPTAADGYGVYYGILDDEIRLAVSGWTNDPLTPKQWLAEIQQSLDDLMALITSW
ncbi:hypothetical protein YK48G_25920 [Lentilactobacillus fungorum]|uniref:Choline/carnitine acyltransferase domain-containing protein n=1 Tax=Lentilactobacillus fungorum TaxID=2201250 RepID=A0ABQ3W4E6_9LACO|nr:choline/carnitine O-acyltransferase [Lentilactobacillus fungorum]GHP15167.1 hypothetical protein YK48G_25920 [Lentilactobacillus fungorum]